MGFLSAWRKGVIEIGKDSQRRWRLHKKVPKNFYQYTHYAFEETDVLFKTNISQKKQFFRNDKKRCTVLLRRRPTSLKIMGFALKPWEEHPARRIKYL